MIGSQQSFGFGNGTEALMTLKVHATFRPEQTVASVAPMLRLSPVGWAKLLTEAPDGLGPEHARQVAGSRHSECGAADKRP